MRCVVVIPFDALTIKTKRHRRRRRQTRGFHKKTVRYAYRRGDVAALRIVRKLFSPTPLLSNVAYYACFNDGCI